jgi:hypothetical protein
MTATRRLAAILAADVAGYSRLMGMDEEGTLEGLEALRRELLDPTGITAGSSRRRVTVCLLRFVHVVDAPPQATEVQTRIGGAQSSRGDGLDRPREPEPRVKGCRCWPRLIRGARRRREQLEPKDRNVNSKAFAVAQG